jgi:hypothetical protein
MVFMSTAVILGNVSATLPTGWNGGTIVNNEQRKAASFSDCAMDANNKLHVVYLWFDNSSSGNRDYLMYTDDTGGAWSSPVQVDVSSNNFFGSGHSIAVDSLGHSYITYINSGRVMLATDSAGKWTNLTVDSANAYSNPSIAVDHNNSVHIAYLRNNSNPSSYSSEIVQATYQNGILTNETVASLPGNDVALGTAIAADTADHLTIAFVEYGEASGSHTGDVVIASNASGAWNQTTLDGSGTALGGLALAMDHNDYSHVLYVTSSNLTNQQSGELKYATNSGGTWSNQTVTGLIGSQYLNETHIVVASNNRPTICYVNVSRIGPASSPQLSYFETDVRTLTSGVWSSTVIPLGLFPSMAIDSGNGLFLVYLGFSSLDVSNSSVLMYATNSSVTLAPSAPVGLGFSIGNGRVALAWGAPTSDGGNAISGYNIYRGSSAASAGLIATVSAADLTYLDTGLTNGDSYYYKVAAVNSVGIGTPTNAILAQPSAAPPAGASPGPVTNVNVVIDDGKVTLKWDLPTTGGPASSLLLYRSTGNVLPSASLANLSADTDSYVDSAVSSGQTYYYWIVPGNPNGSGPAAFSGPVSPTSNPNGDNTLLYTVIVVIALIVIAAGLLAFMRRRKKRQAP